MVIFKSEVIIVCCISGLICTDNIQIAYKPLSLGRYCMWTENVVQYHEQNSPRKQAQEKRYLGLHQISIKIVGRPPGSQIVEPELILVYGVPASVALLPVSHNIFHTAILRVAKGTGYSYRHRLIHPRYQRHQLYPAAPPQHRPHHRRSHVLPGRQ